MNLENKKYIFHRIQILCNRIDKLFSLRKQFGYETLKYNDYFTKLGNTMFKIDNDTICTSIDSHFNVYCMNIANLSIKNDDFILTINCRSQAIMPNEFIYDISISSTYPSTEKSYKALTNFETLIDYELNSINEVINRDEDNKSKLIRLLCREV